MRQLRRSRIRILRLLRLFQINRSISSSRNCRLSWCTLPFEIGHVVFDSVVMVALEEVGEGDEVGGFGAKFFGAVGVYLGHLLIPLSLLYHLLLLGQNIFFEILMLEHPLLLL